MSDNDTCKRQGVDKHNWTWVGIPPMTESINPTKPKSNPIMSNETYFIILLRNK